MSHVHVVESALFAKCKPNVSPILDTLQEFITIISNRVHTRFQFDNPRLQKINQLSVFTHSINSVSRVIATGLI